ncbi:E3 ubiquitin-protein ligase RNF103-like [Schistocerca nitens]|uniref:E3 ubiquitin-protein ligase RNF103-like n=1 Tax=Schistocerca nitens TaxID=7011 RepID=UPI00211918BE|nr:E3 ubiquitin-protein ligase RNF103-like [Schistocerca nitens]XP_049806405.1 E3 ubiquitin-protein ligase RNF103-like [Schistocerca nitens]
MRSFWVQFIVLGVYLLLVFIISRLIDFASWFQHGISSTQVVDPLLLSVRQLKQLLDNRGVSYTGYVEKKELVELVDASAEVTHGEVEHLSGPDSRIVLEQPARFSGGAHFYEQVEDTKDSVWLVQVVPADGEPLLDDLSWHVVRSHLAPFAIRTGVFDCRLDRRLCGSKGWDQPLLLLALPKGSRPKDRVILRTFTSTRPQAIVEWVREQLSIRVKRVKSVEEVQSEWFGEDEAAVNAQNSEVRVLLLTHLLHPPLFLAALSVKFTGRIKFGVFTVKKEDAEMVRKKLGLSDQKLPAYVVVTPERKVVYGRRKFEHFNYAAMNLFLRSVQPETNDVFLCSLVLVNMLVSIRMFQVTVKLWWKHLAQCVWTLVSYNLWLFAIWLLILAVYRFCVIGFILDMILIVVRELNLTEVAAAVRSDLWLMCQRPYMVMGSLLVYLVAIAGFIQDPLPEEDEDHNRSGVPGGRSWWHSLPIGSRWIDCFFRPAQALGIQAPTDFDMEEGIEMLIERLAVPNLWLQPSVIPTDYVKELPLWRFRIPSTSSSENTKCCKSNNQLQLKVPDTHCVDSPETVARMMDGEEPGPRFREPNLPHQNNECKCVSAAREESSESEESTSASSPEENTILGTMGCWWESVPPGMLLAFDCAVCLEPYADGAILCGLPCGHSYHQPCIFTWLSRDNHHCPVCRWPAYRNKVHHPHAD